MPEETKNSLSTLVEDVKKYLDTRLQLIKLEAYERVATQAARFYANLIIILACLMCLLLLSLALGFWLTSMLGSAALGFLAVGGLFVIIVAVLYGFRNRLLIKPATNEILKDIFETLE